MSEVKDFAPALHLVRSIHCSAFMTFDRKLAKRAKALTAISVDAPKGPHERMPPVECLVRNHLKERPNPAQRPAKPWPTSCNNDIDAHD